MPYHHAQECANTLQHQMPDICLPPSVIWIPHMPKDALKRKVISGKIPPLI